MELITFPSICDYSTSISRSTHTRSKNQRNNSTRHPSGPWILFLLNPFNSPSTSKERSPRGRYQLHPPGGKEIDDFKLINDTSITIIFKKLREVQFTQMFKMSLIFHQFTYLILKSPNSVRIPSSRSIIVEEFCVCISFTNPVGSAFKLPG